jgi:hypothetical protein
MMTHKLIRWGVFVPAWLAVVACSSSNGSTPTNPETSDASPGDASMSNTGSNLPVVTLSEAAAAPPGGQSVTCGSKTCTAPAGGMIQNNACCLPDNSCGAFPDLSSLGGIGGGGVGMPPSDDAGGGGCLDVSPGTPDPSCPSQTVMGFALTGCCSKAGMCGVDLSIGGLGCNPLSALGPLASLGGLGAGSPMDAGPAAAPQACGGGSDAAIVANDAAGDASPTAAADAGSE